MSDLFELTKKYCNYQIDKNVQQLKFEFDAERLRREIFKFINDNKFGFSSASLRLPKGQTEYVTPREALEANGADAFFPKQRLGLQKNYEIDYEINDTPNKEYLFWHPSLENSYVSTLVPELEKFCGFNIGRIRLGWLHPDCGYPMHVDLEPLRLHIPIFTNDCAYIIHDHEIYNMKYGQLYHLITTKVHTAWNFGTLPRLHLVFSTYGDDQFEAEISKLKELDSMKENLSNNISKEFGADAYGLSQLLYIANTGYTDDKKNSILTNLKKVINFLPKIQ